MIKYYIETTMTHAKSNGGLVSKGNRKLRFVYKSFTCYRSFMLCRVGARRIGVLNENSTSIQTILAEKDYFTFEVFNDSIYTTERCPFPIFSAMITYQS